jgi:hypothetical protein
VEVLVGAATLAVALAATGAMGDILYMLLIAGALIGIGLMLEPEAPEWPDSQALVLAL